MVQRKIYGDVILMTHCDKSESENESEIYRERDREREVYIYIYRERGGYIYIERETGEFTSKRVNDVELISDISKSNFWYKKIHEFLIQKIRAHFLISDNDFFSISENDFLTSENHFLISEILTFSDIRNWFSNIRESFSGIRKCARFLYQEFVYFLISKIRFSDIRNYYFLYKKLYSIPISRYQKMISLIRKSNFWSQKITFWWSLLCKFFVSFSKLQIFNLESHHPRPRGVDGDFHS